MSESVCRPGESPPTLSHRGRSGSQGNMDKEVCLKDQYGQNFVMQDTSGPGLGM